MEQPPTGDVLSAASLLLAILFAFLGNWYGEIASALAIVPPRHLEDASSDRRKWATFLREHGHDASADEILQRATDLASHHADLGGRPQQ